MEDVAWGGVALALITAVGTAYNTWQNRLAKRDQLQNDAKVVALEADNRACHDSWKRIDAELKDTRTELATCREQHVESEAKHEVSDQDRQRLNAEVEENKRKIAKLEDFLEKREQREREVGEGL